MSIFVYNNFLQKNLAYANFIEIISLISFKQLGRKYINRRVILCTILLNTDSGLTIPDSFYLKII